jgi:hypothetical protein
VNCIFCKQASDHSKSIEHIVPESLGNKEHYLPKGIVCDKCNNYFANKIERPMLELPYFVSARHRNIIENKKRRIPIEQGMLLNPSRSKINFHIEKDGKSLSFEDEAAYNWIREKHEFAVIALVNEKPPQDNPSISKFLGKVAIEAFAKIGLDVKGGIEYIVSSPGLDLLRNYVRFGAGPKFWPYHIRPIYPETYYFIDKDTNESYEVLHEFHLFQTTEHQWHLALVIFGFEYCIDLTGPDIDSYLRWLKNNNNESPLY